MFKFLFALIAVLALVYFGLTFNGYQVNPKNITYYLPKKSSNAVELEFKNGTLLKGEIMDETADAIRINMDGAITSFPKGQIKATRAVSKDFFSQYLETLRTENRAHPLISRKRGMSAAASLDKSSTGFLKQITQVDKLEQMEKIKKDIGKIQAVSDERTKQVNELINN